MWKKGKDMVALGKNTYNKADQRIKVEESENGNTLVILLAEPKDKGIYSCQISSSGGEPNEIRHSVRIRGKEKTQHRSLEKSSTRQKFDNKDTFCFVRIDLKYVLVMLLS